MQKTSYNINKKSLIYHNKEYTNKITILIHKIKKNQTIKTIFTFLKNHKSIKHYS